MNNGFDFAFNYLMNDESRKYTETPGDSGGPTKAGITLKAWQNHVGHPVTSFDIEMLTDDQIKDFYLVRHWNSLKLSQLDSVAVAVCIFDTSVLYGGGTATKMAQLAVGWSEAKPALKFDGIMGDKTVACINATREGDFLTAFYGYVLQRIDQVIRINPEDEKFRKGWTSRAGRLLTLPTLVNSNSGNT